MEQNENINTTKEKKKKKAGNPHKFPTLSSADFVKMLSKLTDRRAHV